MDKRKWTVILLLLILCLVTGCKNTNATDIYGNERTTEYGLVQIKSERYGNSMSGAFLRSIVYDPVTMVCYITLNGCGLYGISPYYVINEDGKPEIAIYGVNYP